MSLAVVYGSKNIVYNVALGKITWNNPLAVIANGGIATPSASNILYRQDLGGQLEALNDDGIPLPIDTCLVYKVTSVAINLAGEFHVHSIYDTGIVEDASNVILFYNNGGEVGLRSGGIYNPLQTAENAGIAYTDANIRTDQQIIDVVTSAGVTVSDYGTALAARIQVIIDQTMTNSSIADMKAELLTSFDNMGLDGQDRAKAEAEFMTQLTTTVISTAMNTGSQSMLTQKQGDLAVRQKEGFNDNLLVKANDSLGGALGLINSGTGSTVGSMVESYSNTISDLISRSKQTVTP